MSEVSPPEDLAFPAAFRYIAFFDLLSDAIFQHRHAAEAATPELASRFARASVLASALSIECSANALLATLDLTKPLMAELDKMSPLGKVESCLRLLGVESFDRGRVEVARVVELIKARNDHVHPKATRMPGTIYAPQDGGAEWIVPMSFDGAHYENLDMPKLSMLWSESSSRAALVAVAGFYAYLFGELIKPPEHDLNVMLMPQMELGAAKGLAVHMPSVSDEIRCELQRAGAYGADFSCFGLFTKEAS